MDGDAQAPRHEAAAQDPPTVVRSTGPLHLVVMGVSGSGKTTVAEALGSIKGVES